MPKVQLESDAQISYANNSVIATAVPVYIVGNLRGKTLNNAMGVGSTNEAHLFALGTSDLSTRRFTFMYYNGVPAWTLVDNAGGLHFFTTITSGSISDTLYYDFVLFIDAGSSVFNIYAAGDMGGTIISQWNYGSSTSLGSGGAGQGCLFVGNCDPTARAVALTPVQQTYDAISASDDGAFGAGADLNSPLEEGSGSAVSPSGTISGTFSWLDVTAAPPMRFVRQQFSGRRRHR